MTFTLYLGSQRKMMAAVLYFYHNTLAIEHSQYYTRRFMECHIFCKIVPCASNIVYAF